MTGRGCDKKCKKGSSSNLMKSLKEQCGEWDLNPHEIAPTRSLVLLVCQFRHLRLYLSETALNGILISFISGRLSATEDYVTT